MTRNIALDECSFGNDEFAFDGDATFHETVDVEVSIAANRTADGCSAANGRRRRHRSHVHVDVALERGAVCNGESCSLDVADKTSTRQQVDPIRSACVSGHGAAD